MIKLFACCVAVFSMLYAASALSKDAAPALKDAKAATSQPTSQPVIVVTPTIPTTTDEALETGGKIYKYFKNGDVRLGIGAVLMVLIFIWRRFVYDFALSKVGKKWGALVAASTGFAVSLTLELMSPLWSWKSFLVGGVFMGGAAVLFWSTLGKAILPKLFGEVKSKKEE